jgi:hypothetical protein
MFCKNMHVHSSHAENMLILGNTFGKIQLSGLLVAWVDPPLMTVYMHLVHHACMQLTCI